MDGRFLGCCRIRSGYVEMITTRLGRQISPLRLWPNTHFWQKRPEVGHPISSSGKMTAWLFVVLAFSPLW